jgi:hypothetical protein
LPQNEQYSSLPSSVLPRESSLIAPSFYSSKVHVSAL